MDDGRNICIIDVIEYMFDICKTFDEGFPDVTNHSDLNSGNIDKGMCNAVVLDNGNHAFYISAF